MIKKKAKIFLALFTLGLFIVWTILVKTVDVNFIGANGSSVGLASINGLIKDVIGVNFLLYEITDWLSILPILIGLGFAVLGVVQWISRKSLLKVDRSLIVLGCFYVIVFFVYFFFEYVIINYRPVFINGYLEASYPSSTTMLVLTFIPTAIMQFNSRIKKVAFRKGLDFLCVFYMTFMVIMRVVSGVHWFSDIIGGVLISTALVVFYWVFEKR